MADKYRPPTMDWQSPGNLHKRFKLFKQKCDLIFDGPLTDKEEAFKVRMLLLWIDDKGLEIYNTASWEEEGDNMKLARVFEKLEAYTKPQSNQILARFQLRCLKQGDMLLEEFVTKARTLVDESGYSAAVVEESLRDALVFGLKSDKVRKDAIALGNNLTFKQIYDLAKTEESTRSQMEVIASGSETSDVHAVRNKPGSYRPHYRQQDGHKNKPRHSPSRTGENECKRCGLRHSATDTCAAESSKCHYCGKVGHYKRTCFKLKKKQLHEVNSRSEAYRDCEGDEDSQDHESRDNTESYVGCIDADQSKACFVNAVNKQIPTETTKSKIFVDVKLNGEYNATLKVDTGADTCILTKQDLDRSGLQLEIKKTNCILHKYGGGKIETYGKVTLKVSYKDSTINTDFIVVDGKGSPSILGCSQSQDLGVISVHIHGVTRNKGQGQTVEHEDDSDSACATAARKGTLTKEQVMGEYGDCFDKIGCFKDTKYHIELTEDAIPVVHPPRSIPLHILPLYEAELKKMIEDDIIEPVKQPTDWVNSIVCNIRDLPDGTKKVRLCLDPKDLNKNIKREHYYTRTIDEILPKLHGKKYLSVVDTKKGYFHVELDEASSLLCTFNTPFGRHKFKRLPFGTRVSQDIFQSKLDEVYRDIPNVSGIADDILIYGDTAEEHDKAFLDMLTASRNANVGLNSDKLQFKKNKVHFFGHTLSEKGIEPAEDKLRAIRNIKTPTNSKELLSILGMITYLNRFSTKIAELTAPLRQLTKKNAHFVWEKKHQDALDKIKVELCSARIISYYDPSSKLETILQCDASQTGIGAWIRQTDKHGKENIVAMGSRSLTDTESRYSNIERECLAVVFGLEKFEYYLLGRHVKVETDHFPLEQIFKKNIAEAPSRLQRLLLRCSKFDITVKYKQGTKIPVADALSRVIANNTTPVDLEHKVDFITGIKSPIDIDIVKSIAGTDILHNRLKDLIYKGWPNLRKQCPQELWDYWNFRCDLVLEDSLILKGDRILIPEKLRSQVLDALHSGHQGEMKCLLLSRQTVFWPGITKDIIEMVKRCDLCNKYQSAQAKFPMMQPDSPTRPWEKLGTDIFEFEGKKYLMIVDYFSRFPVVRFLSDMTANSVCDHFTAILAEYGLPSTILADFGSQYASERFRKKCETNGIKLLFSSPYHHQANSLAERSIGTCKSLWKKAKTDERESSLWVYRVTPLDYQTPSPYELLFGRKPKTFLPTGKSAMNSNHPRNEDHLKLNEDRQEKIAKFYNKNATSDKRPLLNDEKVYVWNYIKRIWEPGIIVDRPNPIREPRSYTVMMNSKLYRRTREHLRPRTAPNIQRNSEVPPTPQVENFQPIATSKPIVTSQGNGSHDKPVNPVVTSNDIARDITTNVKAAKQTSMPYAPRVQTTKFGRSTQVPAKFKD